MPPERASEHNDPAHLRYSFAGGTESGCSDGLVRRSGCRGRESSVRPVTLRSRPFGLPCLFRGARADVRFSNTLHWEYRCRAVESLGVSVTCITDFACAASQSHHRPIRPRKAVQRTVSLKADTYASRRPRLLARELGNVFLGVAVGLLGYYAATGLVTRAGQTELRAEVPSVEYSGRVSEEGPALNFDKWESEDAAHWRSLKPGQAFGRLVARDMRLDAVVVKGVSYGDLRRGPGWIDYTDLPGPTGNVGISGHRTTYGAPFRKLDQLKPGDIIRFYSPYRRYTYRVRRSFSVTPDRVEVVATTETPTLTLTACHPPYSARLRLIVQSELIEVKRLAR